MKANEIMIGDLLRVTKDVCIKKGKIVRVRAIDADDTLPERGLKGAIRCQPIDDKYGINIGGVWADFLEPIPLTAEILEKNGFVEQEFGWRKLNAANWCININIFNGKERYALSVLGINAQVTLHGYYVHELQHALRLCGIDKEIVL